MRKRKENFNKLNNNILKLIINFYYLIIYMNKITWGLLGLLLTSI